MITNTNDDLITRTCLYPLYPQFEFEESNIGLLTDDLEALRGEINRLRQQIENLNDNKRN